MRIPFPPSPSHQRGAAALITVMALVLVTSITFAFANRSLIFEQRTGANQMRSTQALEIADAGLEWATALLNDSSNINDSCLTGTGATSSYGNRYLSIDQASRQITSRNAQPGCVVNPTSGALTCSCPTSGAPTLSGSGGRFTITFNATDLPNGMVRIVSNGSSNESLDGVATVSVVIAESRTANPAPTAALTAGRHVNWQGSGAALYLANTDAATNGITINAGGNVQVESAVNLVSVPGTPQGRDTSMSVIGNDSTLGSMDRDAFFLNTMGATKGDFYNSEKTTRLANPSSLESSISPGKQAFWIGPAPGPNSNTSTFVINGGTFGSMTNPVILVFNGNIEIRGNTTIYGLVYSTADAMDNQGGGNSFIRGAIVAERDYAKGNGSREVVYDPTILKALREGSNLSNFRKLPGSWID